MPKRILALSMLQANPAYKPCLEHAFIPNSIFILTAQSMQFIANIHAAADYLLIFIEAKTKREWTSFIVKVEQ